MARKGNVFLNKDGVIFDVIPKEWIQLIIKK